ncbi:hypothetical protein PGTUg99_037767 [Puccinia graminis f. sp. tritici]|uniref:Uncharacterized protein n=1 Tax=Puccinia graminis f. sp. tritici TaxID=56615 RepID=A0A5B0RB29_PUCGR|nr:hypothetical protein PGTUg99_037767 [Puccinia graminis f. sp. tritici]
MPRLSERQSSLRDLFFMYVVSFEDDLDDMLDVIRRKRHNALMIGSTPRKQPYNSVLSGLEDISQLLQLVLSNRYLEPTESKPGSEDGTPLFGIKDGSAVVNNPNSNSDRAGSIA